LLADIGLPYMGIELIRKVKELLPDLEIMAHTVFDDRETARPSRQGHRDIS
jgi:DNA-binding NarL/FixJ family response regulator